MLLCDDLCTGFSKFRWGGDHDKKKVKVQADHAYGDSFDEVARNLKDAGLTIQDELPFLGHFRGVASAEDIDKLKNVPGVAAIEVIGDEGDEEQDDYSIQ